MIKPEPFRGPGKVPGRVLRKPGKTGGPEKFRVDLDIFNIHLLSIPKRFWNLFNEYNINGLPLTSKAQVGREHLGQRWPKRGGRLGELPGSFPPPPWRSPRQEGTLGRRPRAAPSSKGGSPPPPPINRGGGGTPSTQFRLFLSVEGLPPLSPSLRSNLLSLEVLLLPPLLLRRCRALEGGALLNLPHRTCGSTVERSCVRSSFEGTHGDQDLFVGVFTFTLLQLSIKSSAAR